FPHSGLHSLMPKTDWLVRPRWRVGLDRYTGPSASTTSCRLVPCHTLAADRPGSATWWPDGGSDEPIATGDSRAVGRRGPRSLGANAAGLDLCTPARRPRDELCRA